MTDSRIQILGQLLRSLQDCGCPFDEKYKEEGNYKAAAQIIKELSNGKDDWSRSIFSRIVALRYYKFISSTKENFKITKRAFEFYKQQDPKYYFYKIAIFDKISRTKNKELLLDYYDLIINKNIKEDDFSLYSRKNYGSSKMFDLLKSKSGCNKKQVYLTTYRAFRSGYVGTLDLSKIPKNIFKKILNETNEKVLEQKSINSKKSINDDKSFFTVDNLLELHIEEIIRRNFAKFFPKYSIIDKSKHHHTSNGNYIDILAASKDNEYLIVELKRDVSPQKALVQLLDYVNQIGDDFKTDKVRGVLACKKADNRTKSAIKALKTHLKDSNKIELLEFDLLMSVS